MTTYDSLSRTAQSYVVGVAVVGGAIVAHSVYTLSIHPIDPNWLVLAALTLLTGSFTVKIPSINAHLSVSETFVFVAVLMYGPAAGTVTVLLECLIILLWRRPEGLIHQILFNTAAPAIAIWVSATVFFGVSGLQPYATSSDTIALSVLFLPLLLFTLLYFLLNSWLVALAVGFEVGQSSLHIWRSFIWLSVNYFSGASVAALIVTYSHELDISMLLVIVPLLVVSYLTFRTAMGRVEDTNAHLSDLNRLYLSTIETLAMAIDAKDQITHGHIRRVQAYAVGLAKRLKVTDDKLIKAIEAAALLHDMGKLAVPEYILNKPGKLTAAEFEKMKLHAGVGADILSAIDFPYPVVPIVRHHHENWDGTGYPTGLKGTDIPIGARILSVVDCFDALTSDRPYRPRLSDEQALAILTERRGTMYDPLIVDTFMQVYTEIAPPAPPAVPRQVLREIAKATQPAADTPGGTRPETIEHLTLFDLARTLERTLGTREVAELALRHLRRATRCAQSVLFFYDVGTDELVARQALGDISQHVIGLRISLGQRTSGWVGANRQSIVNSDPVLDLGEVAHASSLQLRSCLSTCVVCGNDLIGVLTAYSEGANSFTEDDRRLAEAVAAHVSEPLRRAVQSEEATSVSAGNRPAAVGRYKTYR
jgi:putative nucleotidyltransferase with HDIG domain